MTSNNKYKTMLCRHFMQGNCALMDKCHFAHGMAELRASNDPLPKILQSQIKDLQVKTYKTQICKYYQKGYCKNQSTCSFAHGQYDLHNKVNRQTWNELRVQNRAYIPNKLDLEGGIISEKTNEDYIMLMVVRELKEVFRGDKEVLKQLNIAQSMYQEGKQSLGNQIISKVVNSSNTSQTQKKLYNIIIINAKTLLNYSNSYLEKSYKY